jgi:SAM-dependent methyltransferase
MLVRDVTAYFRIHEQIGQLPQAREASAQPIAQQRAAFRHLVASFQASRTRRQYVPGVATRLPFATASADLIYSLDCITQYLDRQFDLLLAAVREALRVLRPGGVLTLAPFRDDVFALGYHAERQQCQEQLLAWLAPSTLNWFVEDLSWTGLTGSSRLVIVSPTSGGGGGD